MSGEETEEEAKKRLQAAMTAELARAMKDQTHWAHVASRTFALTDKGAVPVEPIQDLGRAIGARFAPEWEVRVLTMTNGAASVVITGKKGASHAEWTDY